MVNFAQDARDAANEIATTLRAEVNALHKAMLDVADNPTPSGQFTAFARAMELAGTAVATSKAMKATWEAMKEGTPE